MFENICNKATQSIIIHQRQRQRPRPRRVNMTKEIIDVYWDANGFKGGMKGVFRARLRSNHAIHSAGVLVNGAINDILLTLKTFNMDDRKDSYEIIQDW